MSIDIIDAKILEVLQENARISYSELSKRVNLSLSAVSDRLKKLESTGIIAQYTAILDPKPIGRELNAYMMINVNNSGDLGELIRVIENDDEILEASFVAGNFDYIIKIATKNTDTLADLVNRIKSVKIVTRTETTITLTGLKQRFSVPPVVNKQ